MTTAKKCFIIIILLSLINSIFAQTTDNDSPIIINSTEMELFFDEYISLQMAESNIAGVTVSVVKDKQIILQKGYGYADIDNNIAVDSQNTVFILGSLSKLITWTAVMQLVEQGKLDLEADINKYLDFVIPDTFAEPITLKHLMSHNSGFEDIKYGQMAVNSRQLAPLEDWVKTHIPERVFAPGRYIAYGNYTTTLAGYIIESVTGMDFNDYIEQNILQPLNMTSSTFQQPLPENIELNMSNAYLYSKDKFQATRDFNVSANVAPAGALHSTASDMANFMLAHLNEGQFEDASILKSSTISTMHTQSFSHDPYVNGMAHGFWELDMNGQNIIGHAGSHFIFNSILLLYPDHDLGIFIATNSQGGSEFIGSNYLPFLETFTNRFFPQDNQIIATQLGQESQFKRYCGSYFMTLNRSDSTPEKLTAMIMSIKIDADGSGLIINMPNGKLHFNMVAPLIFQEATSGQYLAFEQDDNHRIVSASYSPYPLTALIKSEWYETASFNLLLLVFCIVILISFPISALIRRLLGNKSTFEDRVSIEQVGRWLVNLTTIFVLLFLILAFTSLFNIYKLYVGALPVWNIVILLSYLISIISFALVLFTVIAWIRKLETIAFRIHYTLAAISSMGFVWFIYFWNLLGTKL